ncbi:hypothetical protein FS749_000835 [Ceratobasidium sp. UAMH 11750]|nr:hypothetical protein FS749_000835 [Ceratobasidium sp. UAMH 11750]
MYLEAVAIQTTSFVAAARVFDIWKRPRAAFLTLSVIWLAHCIIDFIIVTDNAIRQSRKLTYLFPRSVLT